MESISSQVQTARNTGAFFLNLPRALLAVRGKDRVSFLHNMLSNDIKGLTVGQARAACLLDRQGKILFSCTAHVRPDEILLEMAPHSLPIARTALERYRISEAVEFSGATNIFLTASVHGPASARLSLPFLPERDGFVVQSALLGMPGLDLWCKRGSSEILFQKLREACRAAGLTEGDEALFDVLRIEAGVPWPGREITPEVILNELDRAEFVSFTKGCYVGQEIVARVKHRAHPPRLLTGFVLQEETIPPERSPVLFESQTVGIITSACFSPTMNKPIALGFLRFDLTEKRFELQGALGAIWADRTSLPFVQPSTGSG